MPCNWVHTFFVRGALDLIYCDRKGQVLHLVAELPPFRFGPLVSRAHTVWELPGGTLRQNPIAVDDRLIVVE